MKTKIRKNLLAELYFDFMKHATPRTRLWLARRSSTSGLIFVGCTAGGKSSAPGDGGSNIDYHQIFGDHERTAVFFAHCARKPFFIFVVIDNTELRSYRREHAPCIFRGRQQALRRRCRVFPSGAPGDMNEAVCVPGEINKVRTKLRVSGDNH